MCDNIQLLCGLCRVGLYVLYRRMCCKTGPVHRPNINVLCLGLAGAGKSALLALLSGDDFHNVTPTIGFSIKALMFDDCILDVKELGGGEKVRMYWDKYYEGSQGVIFVVDSASTDETFTLAKTELSKALSHSALHGLPLLVLANHQDAEGAKSESEITRILGLDHETGKRTWFIQICSIVNKPQVEAGFQKLNAVMMGKKLTPPTDGELTDMNRI